MPKPDNTPTLPVTNTYMHDPPGPPPVPPAPPAPITVFVGFPPMILKWANIIRDLEGSPDPTNPGNLKFAPLTATWGATPGIAGSDGGHLAHFPSYARGYSALCNFLVLACHDELKSYHDARTLGDFTFIYTGKPKPAFDYRPTLSKRLGVPLTTNIATFL